MGITFTRPPSEGAGTETNPIASGSGKVGAGDAVTVLIVSLDDNETLNINEATLVLSDGQPAPSGLDLLLVTYDGAGSVASQSTIISGDGTSQVDVSGDPLTSYTNSTGSSQLAGVLIDNGQVGGGTGSDQNTAAEVDYTKA